MAGRRSLHRLRNLHRHLPCFTPPAALGRASLLAAAAAGAAVTVVATPSAAAAAPQPAPLLSAQRLGGKVCLVTGGASGIGKAICIQLAREGAHVVVFDMRVEPREGGDTVLALMKAAREVEGIAAQQDLFVEGDVSTSSDVQKVMDATLSAYGRLDVLVNNAAKMDGSTLLETSEEEWDAIMAVNAKGTFIFSKAAVGQYLKQPRQGPDGIRGRIVNISSQHGMVYCPGNVAYGTSKAAVAYMTKQIGSEYISDGVVVNAVAPGRILTGRPGSRIEGATEEELAGNAESIARTPHGALRLGEPADIGRAVAFLASDYASFIVGENLMVDGGYKAS